MVLDKHVLGYSSVLVVNVTWDDYFLLDLTNVYGTLTICKVICKMRWNELRRHKQTFIIIKG